VPLNATRTASPSQGRFLRRRSPTSGVRRPTSDVRSACWHQTSNPTTPPADPERRTATLPTGLTPLHLQQWDKWGPDATAGDSRRTTGNRQVVGPIPTAGSVGPVGTRAGRTPGLVSEAGPGGPRTAGTEHDRV